MLSISRLQCAATSKFILPLIHLSKYRPSDFIVLLQSDHGSSRLQPNTCSWCPHLPSELGRTRITPMCHMKPKLRALAPPCSNPRRLGLGRSRIVCSKPPQLLFDYFTSSTTSQVHHDHPQRPDCHHGSPISYCSGCGQEEKGVQGGPLCHQRRVRPEPRASHSAGGTERRERPRQYRGPRPQSHE